MELRIVKPPHELLAFTTPHLRAQKIASPSPISLIALYPLGSRCSLERSTFHYVRIHRVRIIRLAPQLYSGAFADARDRSRISLVSRSDIRLVLITPLGGAN